MSDAQDATGPSDRASDEAKPLREDQIQNAIAFLSHPKVRGSPEASKRTFLENKGLTVAEIAEAFRRVPETATPAPEPSTAGGRGALANTANHLQPAQPPYQQQQQQLQPQQQPIRWSQVVLGAGFVGASAYAVKSLAWPFVHDKITSWRAARRANQPALPPPSAQDTSSATAAVAPSDAVAIADAIRAQTAELATSIAAIKQLAEGLESKRAASPEDRLTVSELRQELRSFATSLNDIAAGTSSSTSGGGGGGVAAAVTPGGGASASVESELAEIKALLAEYVKTPREYSGDVGDTQGATPGSYRSASEQLPSGVPSPLQLAGTSRRPGNAADALYFNGNNNNNNNNITTNATERQQQEEQQAAAKVPPSSPPIEPEQARHPSSYMEVLEMLERGETPPGIRNDINDKPPNPTKSPPAARMKPLPKPWERNTTTSTAAGSDGIASGGGHNEEEEASGSISLSPEPRHVVEDSSNRSGSSAQSPFGQPAVQHVSASSPVVSVANDVASSTTKPSSTSSQETSKSPLKALADGANRRAASLFEATSPQEGSPGVVAHRLSSAGVRRELVLPSSVDGQDQQQHKSGDERQSLPAAHPVSATSSSWRSAGGAPSLGVPDGSGLGRPASRGWRPPPIPMPTLSGVSGGGSVGGGRVTVPEGKDQQVEVDGGVAEAEQQKTPQSASTNTLGDDDFNM